jgi:ribosomal protein S18 acetylase RimI-like enzyme
MTSTPIHHAPVLRPCPSPPGPVRVRELHAGETDVLDAVFAGLSPTSRYHRFHGPLPRLTPEVRERLAAVDGRTHVAVAGVAPDGRPVGIARLMAVGGGPAELAVEVVDAWQHRGVGTRLVAAVVALGRAAGMREVAADVLAENGAALGLAHGFPGLREHEDGPEVRFTGAIPADAEETDVEETDDAA